MKNKNDSDWTFTVRMHKIAAHSRISRGLTHRLLDLHSGMSTDGKYQVVSWAPRIISRDLSGQPTRGHPLY